MKKCLYLAFLAFLQINKILSISETDVLGPDPDAKSLKQEYEVIKSGLADGITVVLESESISFKKGDSESPSDTHHNGHNEEPKPLDESKKSELLHQSELESEILLRSREGEISKIPKGDGALHASWKFLFHVLYSRAGNWSFTDPSTVGLGDISPGKHQVIKSSAETAEGHMPIPELIIYSISHLPPKIPTKPNKSPIFLFGMEGFVVLRLIHNLIEELTNSHDSIEEKILLAEQWVHFVKHHFLLFFPYNVITAKRCVRLLENTTEGEDKEILDLCKKMVEKTNGSDLLQTYLMIDPETNVNIADKCIKEKHLIPSFIRMKPEKLTNLHLKHDIAMELSNFISTANMIMANVEQHILSNADFLEPKFWGVGLKGDEVVTAENHVLKLYTDTQKELNNVIKNAFTALLEKLDTSSPKENDAVKVLLKSEDDEFEAAKQKAKDDDNLSKNIEEAKTKFLNFASNGSSGGEEFIKEMSNDDHAEWKGSASAHILDVIINSCSEDPVFCFSALEHCRTTLETIESDTVPAVNLIKFHKAISAALLKSKKLEPDAYIKELSKYIKHDQSELPQTSSKKIFLFSARAIVNVTNQHIP